MCNSSAFNSTPVSGICECLNGTLTNGACVVSEGCLTPLVLPDGSVLCNFCNISRKFRLEVNAQGQCECIEKYQVSG